VNPITLDSNVIISALIWGGKPLQLFELALTGEIELAVSPDILDETLRILRGKFRLEPEDLAKAEGFILKAARVVTPTERLDVVQADPDDNRIVACAVAAGSDTIVSGDVDLLRMRNFRGVRIQRVSEFLARFQSRER
jgi:uncharacterized protein